MICNSESIRRPLSPRLVVVLTLLFSFHCPQETSIAESPDDEPHVKPNAALQYWMALQFVPTVWGDEWLTLRHDPYHCPLEEVAGLFTDWNRRNIVDPVHRGARIRHCDWQLPVADCGPETLLWHVNKNREIISFLVADARQHFARDDQKQAVSNLCDGIVFLRHLASDGTQGSYPVLVFVEPKLVQLIAHLIPQMETDALGLLSERLEELADPISLSERIKKQKAYYVSWLRSEFAEDSDIKNVILGSSMIDGVDEVTKESLEKSLSGLNGSDVIETVEAAYDAVINVLKPSREDFDTAYQQLIAEIRSDPLKQLFVGSQVDGLIDSRNHESLVDLRIELLKAGIVFERDGEHGFQRYVEKAAFGSPTLSSSEGSYTLECKARDNAQQLALRFGEGALPPPRKKREVAYDFGNDASQKLDDALRYARESDKLVLLNFGANWCAPCHVLHKTLTEDKIVSPIVNQHFIIVKVNIGDFSQNRDITTRYALDLQKRGVPYLMAVDADGKPVLIDGDNDSPRIPTGDVEKLKQALKSAIALHARTEEPSSK